MNTINKKITPEEMVLQVKSFSKEEALDFLYRAGITTKNGNYRKFYQGSIKEKILIV